MKRDKLKSMKMPKKAEMGDEEIMADLDMLEEEGPEDGDMAMEDEMPMEDAGMLEDVSDEELLAELEKRGLAPASEDMAMEDEEEEMDLEDEDEEEALA